MIKYIIQIADVHIKSYKEHEERKTVLTNFINEIKPFLKKYGGETRIVVCGDFYDSKLTISNEGMIVLGEVLRELDEIGTVLFIAGNHDFIQNNMQRTDSITPLFKLMKFKRTSYVDMVTEYKSACVEDDNIIWCLYSIFDDYRTPDFEVVKKEHPDKTYIGLFHGPVIGSKTFNGVMERGVNMSLFEGLDFVCAGDIHVTQTLETKTGVKLHYPGSLCQINFGESINNHGYSIITLPDFTIEHKEIENPFQYYTFKINGIENLENDEEKLINIRNYDVEN
jgi:DNA repair exonuclease SbcCD nuclease subunit